MGKNREKCGEEKVKEWEKWEWEGENKFCKIQSNEGSLGSSCEGSWKSF